MRIAYLDGFSGVSGDMLLGALIHAGAPIDLLRETLAALDVGATLQVDEVSRGGIQSRYARILVDGQPAEGNGHAHHHDGHGHHDHHGDGEHHHQEEPQSHHSHRSLSAIRELISAARLAPPVTKLAIHAFELLGAAEAKIHGCPIESVHFHEVGAADAIADIVLVSAASHVLGIERWHCSPLNVGGGTIQCAHGLLPVPAPATAELLLGAPTFSSGARGEMVTPTGAALVRAFDCEFSPLPAMLVESIGYGAGTRNPADYPNVARVQIGEAQEQIVGPETVMVLEVAVDDLNPQVIAYVTEKVMRLGALDVMCTPVFMKKNRPGTLLTVLADLAHAPALEELLLRETSTLGLRVREERRVVLERRHAEVATAWGRVRVKIGHRDGQEFNVAPEFEDCRRLAETHAVPVKRVLEAALQAYRQEQA